MKNWICFIALTALAICAAAGTEDLATTFYIQIVHGTDQEKSKNPEWKSIGPKLRKTLSSVFKWKHYWEVKRLSVSTGTGKASRIHLIKERDLEIKVLKSGQAELRLIRKGDLKRKLQMPLETRITILGGDADEDQGWFIVVRRDKPSTD
jgi:hypothetical protein